MVRVISWSGQACPVADGVRGARGLGLVATGIVPLSARLAAFHESQRDSHLEMAREHGRRGHARAEQDHLEAAAAHQGRGLGFS